MASTYDRLKKIVVEQLGVDEEEVKPEASFVDDLNADSLDLVELIMSLEEEFGTEISDEDAEQIRTVGDAVEYIDERNSDRSRDLATGHPRDRGPGRPPRRAARSPDPGPTAAGPGADPLLLAPRAPRRAAAGHNERLEFLGDAVINLAVSEALYARHPDDDEGLLSARRAAIVSTTGLAALADAHHLGALPRPRRGRDQPRRATAAGPPRLRVRGARRRDPARPRLGPRRATGSSHRGVPEIDAGVPPAS